LGIGVPNGFPNLQRVMAKVKIHWIEAFLKSLENSWNLNFEIGLNDPFGHLKHILWPRAGSQIDKLISTTKSQGSPRYPCVGVVCNIRPLESLDEGYNLASDLIPIEGLHTKLWAPK
jgi:hypothetical protein